MGRICPAQEYAPRRRPPDTAHERRDLPPRENTPLGESLPTRRTGERICPAQKHSPRRRPTDTAHERKDLPHARTLSSAKASRHGARAKGFAPRESAPHGESLPTRRTSERICPARERSPRRRPPDTAHEQKDLCRAGTRPTAKAYRHGARAKGFAPRENAPLGEGLPTRRTSKRICPTREGSPRRRPPDTARRRKDLPRAEPAPPWFSDGALWGSDGAGWWAGFAPRENAPTAKASRHGARAKGFAQRGSRSLRVPTNGGPPSTDERPEKHPFGGVAPERARPLPSSFTEKKKTTP